MIFINFLPVLLFINNVNSVILDKNVKREVARTRGSYKYYQPPSAIFFSVPVSVVYDDGSRKEKSVQKNVSTTPGTTTRGSSESKKITITTNKPLTTPDSDEFVKTTLRKNDNNSTTKEKDKNVAILKQEIAAAAVQTTPKINDDKEVPTLEISTKAALIKSTSEENEPSENKSSTEKTPSGSSTPNINTNSESKVTVSSTTTDNNAIITNINDNESSKLRIYMPRDGLIIPVAVVYDVAPEPIRRRHKVQANPNIRQQRNKYTDTKGTSTEKTENKQVAKESNINENIKSGMFPKRTGEPNPFVPIIQSENYVFSHSGDFHYSYEGGDGTKAAERGALKADKAGEAVEGSFSYIGNDGKDYSLTYTADENGYRPVGEHLPTPPPIPPAIARALKYLATKPTPETITESYY